MQLQQTPPTTAEHPIQRRLPFRPSPRTRWTAFGSALLLGLASWKSWGAPGVHFTPVSTFEAGSGALSVRLSGNTAYFVDGETGVHILDVANPAQPSTLGLYDSPGYATELQLVGNRGYLADGAAGLQILDLSQPANPQVLGTYSPGVMVLDAKISGNRAYLACGESGLQIVDISDPANPVKLGELVPASDEAFTWANKLHVVGTTVYLSTGFFAVIDVTDPANPVELSRWEDGVVVDCAIRGNRAYLAAADDGILVFDITNPSRPVRLTRVPAPGGAYAALLDGNRLFTHIGVVDISDPVSPVLLGTYPQMSWGDQGLALAGDLLFQPDGANQFRILRFRAGETQSLGWSSPTDRRIPVGTSQPLGGTSSSGLPVTAEIVSGPATYTNGLVHVTGTGVVELRLLQAGDPTYLPAQATRFINRVEARLELLGSYALSTNLYGARVFGNRAYLGNDGDGLRIVDVSDLAKPVLLSTVTTTNQTLEAEVVGSHAFVADGASGLKVVNVEDPRNPVTLTNVPAGTAISVRVRNNLAFVTDVFGRKLLIFDVSNPAAPVTLSETSLPGDGRNTTLDGNLAYVSCGSGGVLVLDITQPSTPAKVGTFLSGHFIRGLAIKGNVAFVPSYFRASLRAVDVSDPTKPVELGSVPIQGYPRRIEIVGDLGFVVSEASGLHVVDLKDPTRMSVLGVVETGGYPRDIQTLNDVLYVADQQAGFKAYRLDQVGFPVGMNVNVPAATPFGTPIPLAATADNGLPTRFSVASGPGRIVGNQLIPTGIGVIEVRAETESTGGFLPGRHSVQVHATLPDLALHLSGGSISALWPAGLEGVQLLRTPELAANALWTAIPGPFTEANGTASTSLDASQGNGFLRLDHPFPGVPEPLSLSGWNRDVVLENQPEPKAEAIDPFSGAWFESGLNGYTAGLPSNREIVHQEDALIRYRLQPYTEKNVLMLTDETPRSALVLTTPVACSRLFILSAGTRPVGSMGAVTVHFTDGTSTDASPWISPSWNGLNHTGQPIPSVFPGVGRSSRATRLTASFGDRGFTMFQTVIDLASGPHAGKPIARIEFRKNFEPMTVNGVYAISGIRTPSRP